MVVGPDGVAVDGPRATQLRQHARSPVCNWLVPGDSASGLCLSCSLTRTRPGRSGPDRAAAVRRGRGRQAPARDGADRTRPARSSAATPIPSPGCVSTCCPARATRVITGHDDGVITLDLAESDDVHREQLRTSMDEPYRTLLGHFRHEIGHYYFALVTPGQRAAGVRARCSATRPRTTRPRWTGTTATARRQGWQSAVHLVLRHDAPGRGLGRDVRALPAHPRRARHRRGVRVRARRRDAPRSRWPATPASTGSSSCGCRCRGR